MLVRLRRRRGVRVRRWWRAMVPTDTTVVCLRSGRVRMCLRLRRRRWAAVVAVVAVVVVVVVRLRLRLGQWWWVLRRVML